MEQPLHLMVLITAGGGRGWGWDRVWGKASRVGAGAIAGAGSLGLIPRVASVEA